MLGGITPKYQPLDNFVVKVFKLYYRYYHDNYMLSVSENDKGHIIMPRLHICDQWVAKAWNKLFENFYQRGLDKFWR